MNQLKFYFFLSLLLYNHTPLLQSSSSDSSSEVLSEASIPNPEITQEQFMHALSRILNKQNMGIILSTHSTVLSSDRHGLSHYLEKQLKIKTLTPDHEDPIILKSRFSLPNDDNNTGLDLFEDDSKPMESPEEIEFWNQPLSHPAISENPILDLIQTLRCESEIQHTLLKIILGQISAKIICGPSLHQAPLSTQPSDRLHIFVQRKLAQNKVFLVTNPSDYPRIKQFVITAITNILNKKETGSVECSNGICYTKDTECWQKTMQIDCQDNAGCKHPLSIKMQLPTLHTNLDTMDNTNQPFKHDAYPCEEEIREIINNAKIAKPAQESLLKILSGQRSGEVICTRDVYENLFTTAKSKH